MLQFISRFHIAKKKKKKNQWTWINRNFPRNIFLKENIIPKVFKTILKGVTCITGILEGEDRKCGAKKKKKERNNSG